MIDRKKFYDEVRVSLFGGKLTAEQVEGMEALLNEGQRQNVTDPRHVAYILATVFHEVGRTMQPIEEIGKGRRLDYGKRLKYGGGPGKRIPYKSPAQIYYGRGHTQNTWYEIYQKLSIANDNGWDFLNSPELLLQTGPSAWASVYAMKTGLYTGRKLSQYFNFNINNPIMARSIVNGRKKGEKYPDKAELIAGHYQKFLSFLI